MAGRYALSKMGTRFMVGTVVVLLAPVVCVILALVVPGAVRLPLLLLAVILAVVGMSIWLFMRPSFFELTDSGLRIRWPLRSRMIPRHTIRSARVLSQREFDGEFGSGVRIGAGGAWGRFGLYKTPKATFSLWASRCDQVVVVELGDDRPLLITPARPQEFVAQLARS
jgi:hypothetical protein